MSFEKLSNSELKNTNGGSLVGSALKYAADKAGYLGVKAERADQNHSKVWSNIGK
ncbi:hypothetical protein ACWEWU_08375 [Staphylococcus xylosus]|uniref:hypothetical protein n=1 Tax=Staphylococcus shinii TaxID=2912228 RepID=UPI0015E0CD83|nr:hypothetical protein [Staphylococcus shinii]